MSDAQAQELGAPNDLDRSARVYFIHDGDLIKIGSAENLAVRVGQIAKERGGEVTLLGSISSALHSELSLHQRFANIRVEGEWFKPATELLTFIDGLRAELLLMEPGAYSYRCDGQSIVMIDEVRRLRRELHMRARSESRYRGLFGVLAGNLKVLDTKPNRHSVRSHMLRMIADYTRLAQASH